jgi:hypothetical protein
VARSRKNIRLGYPTSLCAVATHASSRACGESRDRGASLSALRVPTSPSEAVRKDGLSRSNSTNVLLTDNPAAARIMLRFLRSATDRAYGRSRPPHPPKNGRDRTSSRPFCRASCRHPCQQLRHGPGLPSTGAGRGRDAAFVKGRGDGSQARCAVRPQLGDDAGKISRPLGGALRYDRPTGCAFSPAVALFVEKAFDYLPRCG